MKPLGREGTAFYLTLIAATAMFLFLMLGSVCHGADLTDAINATCKIHDTGAVGTGFLYETGPEQTGGEELAWIATAAHVVEDGNVTVQFGTVAPIRARVLWRNRRVDGGVLVVPYRALPRPLPKPIRLAPPSVRVQVGQQLWSIGFPNGGPKLAWKGQAVKYEGGTLIFRPGPELGRSGSAILAEFDGELRAVGILSARDSRGLSPWTQGRAVGTSMLLGETQTAQPAGITKWFPCQGQCGPNGCPPQGGNLFDPYRFSPYRQKQDEINRNQNQRIGGLERSQGTMPLPEQPAAPPVDLAPIVGAVDRLQMDVMNLDARTKELERRADVVKATAEELAKKYEDKLPGISADVGAAIKASEAAAAAAKIAADEAAKAKADALAADGKATAVDGKVETVKGVADAAKTAIEVATDEDNPKGLAGKLAAFKEGGLGKLSSLNFPGLSGTGLGIAGVVLGIIALFVRRDVKDRRTTRAPLIAERGADAFVNFASGTSNQFDDRLAAFAKTIITGLADRVAPKPTDPTQPQ